MAKKKVEAEKIIDPTQMQPTNPAEFLQRAWSFYAKQKYTLAQTDFETVVNQDAMNFDALFGLALALKSDGAIQQALAAFEKALTLVDSTEDKQRANIMGRLIRGHINQIKTGDWNLEKEVWRRDP